LTSACSYPWGMNGVQAGRALAERHGADTGINQISVDRGRSLLNFSEVTGVGDWSLRSALCRMAQPEPVRVGRVLESVRRLDAVLHHFRPALEQQPAFCERPVDDSGTTDRYPDVRTADIARLAADGFEIDSILTGYTEDDAIAPVDDEERAALPILVAAVRFERLSAVLTGWAHQGPGHQPIELFDRACDDIEALLDRLGVPRETGPPGPGGRSRPGR